MSTKVQKVIVLGAGSFGTAMAMVAARRGHDVVIVARDQMQVDGINKEHRNPKRLSDFVLPNNISASTDIAEASKGASLFIHCIPMQSSPAFLRNIRDKIPPGVPFLSTSKGIHVETMKLMCEIIPECLGEEGAPDPRPVAFLSGPSFAKEIMQDFPTTVTVASTHPELSQQLAEMLSSRTFRVYKSTDVLGLELGGALKNPLAIGAGFIEGMGYGYNTLAAFVTRGCSEMRRLAEAMGGKPETLAGLGGIGDLMLTAFGSLSRNRTVGSRLGKGEKLEDILRTMGEVAEGVPTAGVVVKLAEKYNLDLPIFTLIAAVLAGKIDASECVDMLMLRPPKHED